MLKAVIYLFIYFWCDRLKQQVPCDFTRWQVWVQHCYNNVAVRCQQNNTTVINKDMKPGKTDLFKKSTFWLNTSNIEPSAIRFMVRTFSTAAIKVVIFIFVAGSAIFCTVLKLPSHAARWRKTNYFPSISFNLQISVWQSQQLCFKVKSQFITEQNNLKVVNIFSCVDTLWLLGECVDVEPEQRSQ